MVSPTTPRMSETLVSTSDRDKSGGNRSSAVYRRAAPTLKRVVQDVLLRHDGDVFLQGLEVGEEVFAVHRHGPGVGRISAAEDRQEGRLARPARAEQADELPGSDHEADVVEQSQGLTARPVLDHTLEPPCGQLDVVRPRPADEPCPVELERERPDVDAVVGLVARSAG